MHYLREQHRRANRSAAVAVEFAVVAPVLLAILLSTIEMSRAYNAQNLLQTAAREGARFAAMDRTGILPEGQTANAKLVSDVTRFLSASGIPASAIQVTVRDAEDPTSTFDLDDEANTLKLFTVNITCPFSAVSLLPISESYDYMLEASITFRNGRAVLSH